MSRRGSRADRAGVSGDYTCKDERENIVYLNRMQWIKISAAVLRVMKAYAPKY